MKEDREYDMAEINATVIDNQTGDVVLFNDLSQGTYDVICRAGPSFRNRQEETVAAIIELSKVDPSILEIGADILLDNFSTPAAEQLSNRKRAMMIKQGLIPMDQLTEEELAEMQQQAQGQQQPDAAMVMAQAEMAKAQAEQAKVQVQAQELQLQLMKIQIEAQKNEITAQKTQADIMANQAKTQISGFEAETGRIQAQIKAEEAGATINMKNIESFGEQLDNQQKMAEMIADQQRAQQMEYMTTEELIALANR